MEGLKEKNKTVMHEVFELLSTHPDTRNSDKLLWLKMLEIRGFKGRDIETILFDPKVPDFGTVGRCRRKIQQTCPELKAVDGVSEQRFINEMYWNSFGRAKRTNL